MRRDRSIPDRPLIRARLAAALLSALLLVACGSDEPPDTTTMATAGPPPTPTLAMATGDSLPRPPTPEILPTPTGEQVIIAPTPIINDPVLESAAAADPTGDTSPAAESVATPVALPTPVPESDYELPAGADSAELLALGTELYNIGNYRAAVKAYRAVLERDELTDAETSTAGYGLGMALLEDGQPAAAAEVFAGLSAQAVDGREAGSAEAGRAAFQLGRAQLQLGDTGSAISSFETYLKQRPDLAAYVQPLIAQARAAQGDTAGAIDAYRAAVAAPSHRLNDIALRRELARQLLAAGDYAGAIEQYDGIHDQARTEITRGEMTYLAGKAELLAGNTQAGYDRYLFGMTTYPRAVESYYGLSELVEAGVPVDEYQRGVVDYYAGAYQPGIEAFRRYMAAEPETYDKKTHLFLAWTYEALGDLETALAELERYAAAAPDEAGYQRAEMLARAGRNEEAIAAYQTFRSEYPAAEQAPEAAWDAAALAEALGADNTIDRYLYLAENYPAHADAPEAIARAAWLAGQAGDDTRSLELYQLLIERYPQDEYGAEALVWLMRLAAEGRAPGVDLAALQATARSLKPSHYFAIRARDVANGVAPFAAAGPLVLPSNETLDRREAEVWLRDWLTTAGPAAGAIIDAAAAAGEPLPAELGSLSAVLADDPRRIVGEELWRLGLPEEAKAELESLRETHANDPLANYQLAIYFRDLGLYRSSIIAAASLINQTGRTVFDAPRFLARLSYPAYYIDMIQPLAEQYGFDPRLQLALVRQESLFESFARSSAAAQGLSQVIPDTGAWIATQLAWPDFVNEDLYKPYVGLAFGSYYLYRQLQGFEGNVHAALAAYNAGPGNAARWYETAGSDHDGFVDAINFSETRQYVERIYQGFSAYNHLYGP